MPKMNNLNGFAWLSITLLVILSFEARGFEKDPHWYLAEAVYYEARGESIQGQYAVAHVILNRVEGERFPDNVFDVVYQPHQFSYTTDGSLRTPIDYDSLEWYNALRVSGDVLTGSSEDNTGGADHYLNIRSSTDGWWRFFMTKTTRIGLHWFYKDK